ncbi:1,4-alpha-glucan-branching enzyme 1, chloroplastic/amyloplastic-like [Hibiscus syriacus]|uniref:1,4-alpha-glucan-branching enzyme 1, chloroplastic/amyloplastic-like n=1 Tax=Hibiscus syriacus TaxID=106335 RepID=UPI001922229C|nr:1,4-alpha-glucan-branching enzyme 1, chloroplastic/amyloplastic-like [Hibiscus syriacus]
MKMYKVGCDLPGKYRVALDSDAWEFGGHGRVAHDVDHFTSPEGVPGMPETNFNNRPNSFKVLSPAHTCVVYYKVDESLKETNDAILSGVDEMLKVDASKQENVEESTILVAHGAEENPGETNDSHSACVDEKSQKFQAKQESNEERASVVDKIISAS